MMAENISGDRALYLSGRFRRTSATPSWMSIVTSSLMALFAACSGLRSVGVQTRDDLILGDGVSFVDQKLGDPPGTGRLTGISIFIDSRMKMMSPSATASPTPATRFQTLPATSDATSTDPLNGAILRQRDESSRRVRWHVWPSRTQWSA